MKIGFILTTYDRVDDLLAHLDILKFFPAEHTVIPIWMKVGMPDRFMAEMRNYPAAHYVNGISFTSGPLLALASGLRKAGELGLDYVLYRNGDDWMFNHDLCLEHFRAMENYDVAAYNWLTVDSDYEYAINELCLRVDKFLPTVDVAEGFFRKQSKTLCEVKLAKWVKAVGARFRRQPGREMWPGVGYEPESLPALLKFMEEQPPDSFWEGLNDNNRFFCREWQLIGSHDDSQRRRFYEDIKDKIPYREELEKCPHFSRWLVGEGEWNFGVVKRKTLPSKPPKKIPRRFVTPT